MFLANGEALTVEGAINVGSEFGVHECDLDCKVIPT